MEREICVCIRGTVELSYPRKVVLAHTPIWIDSLVAVYRPREGEGIVLSHWEAVGYAQLSEKFYIPVFRRASTREDAVDGKESWEELDKRPSIWHRLLRFKKWMSFMGFDLDWRAWL